VKVTELDAANFDYFSSPERTGVTENVIVIMKDVLTCFKGAIVTEHETAETYPLLKLIEKPEEREAKNCDMIFCEYLMQVSKLTNPEYFATIVKFIILYRECVNKYGWLKFENRITTDIEQLKTNEYTLTSYMEFIPDLANELVLSYLPEHKYPISINDCTNLAINFCTWLLNNGYTCLKITSVKK